MIEPYSNYKQSDCEWNSTIPKSWNEKRIKNLIVSHQGGAWGNEPNGTDNDIICIRVADFKFQNLTIDSEEYTIRNYTDAQIQSLGLHAGDILIEKSGGGDLNPVGRAVIFNKAFFALYANFLERIRPASNINAYYLGYVLAAMYYAGVNRNYFNQTTGIQNLNVGKYLNEKAPVPSNDEQAIIVSFLDHKTAQIDNLIADKEKLIALLKEKRQAIISEAVTRGLDSTVLMKDSGVEWIGQIPAHWDKKRIKFVFEIVKRIYGKEDRDVLSITQHGIKVRDIESNDGQLAQDYSKYQVVNIHDFAMNSMDLLTGYVDCSAYEGVTSPDYRVFRFIPEKVMCHAYYTYLFQMCYTNKIFYGFGQGVSNLGRWRLQTNTFLNFWIPIPPLNEQEEIANYITVQAKRIDGLIALAERQIVLLKEYRQSVISEAVTGKIMVVAPQSVEQAEQPAAKSGGANVYFKHRVLAAKILDKLCGEPTLGHVKLEKLLFLSEYCAELDMHTEYVRHAAGPYNPKTLRSIDTQLQKAKWFVYDKNNRGSKYNRLDKSAEYLPYFDANFSTVQNATIERLIELFRTLDTERCEIVATLYGAWNDFLIDGCSPTDEQIADEVLTHWSEEKKRIDKDRWLKAIGWMRKHQIVPCGYGEKTKRRNS